MSVPISPSTTVTCWHMRSWGPLNPSKVSAPSVTEFNFTVTSKALCCRGGTASKRCVCAS
eukprot:6478769-Amphidinium_carterae.1